MRARIDAATLGGKTLVQVNSTAASHLSWGVVNSSNNVVGKTADLTFTHTQLGLWCVTIAGVDLSAGLHGGITATPDYDFDNTSFSGGHRCAGRGRGRSGSAHCPHGVQIFTYNIIESNGTTPLADNAFEVTIIH